MIHTHKLNRLSQDEMTVLLYCINDGDVDPPKIDYPDVSIIKYEYAFKMLNHYASKLSDSKKKQQLQDIADKISNP